VLIAARRFQLRPKALHVAGGLAYAMLLLAAGWWASRSGLGLVAGMGLLCALAVVLAALTGLLPWRAALRLVRERVGG
jgi:hypothetical protein